MSLERVRVSLGVCCCARFLPILCLEWKWRLGQLVMHFKTCGKVSTFSARDLSRERASTWQRLQNKLAPSYISILMKWFFILHQDNSHLVYFLLSLQNWLAFGAYWCMRRLDCISAHTCRCTRMWAHTHTQMGTFANAHTNASTHNLH